MVSISVVTPSYNQAAFLEDAIRSVLDQEHPALEYVVADGGSDDGSAAIAERYADRLAAWWSERDEGPADAVNRGFARTTGEVMGWLNSDDVFLPGALDVVGEIFDAFPHVDWLTSACPCWLDDRGRLVSVGKVAGFHREAFRRGRHGGVEPGGRTVYVPQASTFWRRSLWERAGGRLDPRAEPAADFELWSRFFEHAQLYAVETVLGAFRLHSEQRTETARDEYLEHARRVLRRAVPGRFAPRLGLGWQAPVITWSREAGSWREGRRLLR